MVIFVVVFCLFLGLAAYIVVDYNLFSNDKISKEVEMIYKLPEDRKSHARRTMMYYEQSKERERKELEVKERCFQESSYRLGD